MALDSGSLMWGLIYYTSLFSRFIIKILVLPKLIYIFKLVPIKTPAFCVCVCVIIGLFINAKGYL